MNKKVGRNDPCPCGSGKKYKSCCMKKQEEGKKVYSSDGKRKFKARVIDSSQGAQEIFSKAGGGVPQAGGDPNVFEKLRFRMTDHDYRASEEAPKEEESTTVTKVDDQPKPKDPSKFNPGADFKMADEDFRVEEK